MDKFQRKLRILIATGSTIGFLGGWALLAHAGKPVSNMVPTTSTTTTVQSVNLPPLDFNALESNVNAPNVQSFAPPPSFQSFGGMRLRTGGS
jgi:hypothetical protein